MIQQDDMKKNNNSPKATASQWQKWKQNPKDLIPAPSFNY